MTLFKSGSYLFIVLVLASFLAFWKIGNHDLSEWDESRNGVNAYEMYYNRDFINLYYAHELDTWNAKPPLMIWLIVLSYKCFGFNEFALRLPSVLSMLLFFVVFYRLMALMDRKITAFLSCLLLISCRAVIGVHVGISGDFDALLMLFLISSAYYFVKFVDFGEVKGAYLTALFTGLAFYSKGTAALLFVPGFMLYTWLRGKWKYLLFNRHTWLSCLLFIAIALTWVGLILIYGQSADHSVYGSKNALETMFVHDTFRRLTSRSFELIQESNRFFFFVVLDLRMNIWNYLFYLSLLVGIGQLYIRRNNWSAYISDDDNRTVLLSSCILFPMILIMTFGVNKHDWYMAPFFGFVAFIAVKGALSVCKMWKPFYPILTGILCFCLVKNFLFINGLPEALHKNEQENKCRFKNGIVIKDLPRQDILLYLEWLDLPLTRVNDAANIAQYKGQTFIAAKSVLTDSTEKSVHFQTCFDNYCAFKIE